MKNVNLVASPLHRKERAWETELLRGGVPHIASSEERRRPVVAVETDATLIEN